MARQVAQAGRQRELAVKDVAVVHVADQRRRKAHAVFFFDDQVVPDAEGGQRKEDGGQDRDHL